MAYTKTAYRNYLFEQINDSERLAVEHSLYKPNFVQRFQQVLSDYSLAAQIRAAQVGSRPTVKILDVACGEGLYLHDVAGELEGQGLLTGTVLYGLDNDATAIETANQFSQVSQPPRPYLNFYWQDLTQPLDTNLFGEPGFDFIYAHITLAFLPNAQQNLANLYNLLKPGGVIFVRDIVLHEGEGGWSYSEPAAALRPFSQAISAMIETVNGQDVSLQYAGWLRELGAGLIQACPDILLVGGASVTGMQTLRAVVMTLRNLKPLFISLGLMTEQQVDDLLILLYRQVSSKWVGKGTYMSTLARKPV